MAVFLPTTVAHTVGQDEVVGIHLPEGVWMSVLLMQRLKEALLLARTPAVEVDLMCRETVANDDFYKGLVLSFYRSATARHRRFPLVGAMTFGVALCRLPEEFESYMSRTIESSGKRNVKKAERLGYGFRRFDYNAHLADVASVRTSTDVRQDALTQEFLSEELRPCPNPPSRTRVHDYPYYGVFKEGRMAAFAGCFVCGRVLMVEQIFGHASAQGDGVVPMLIAGMAREAIDEWPAVEFYMYGMYLGAGPTMRRFKRKFGFLPSRVRWVLGQTEGEHRTRGRGVCPA